MTNKANPIHYIKGNKDVPPFLLMHGTVDTVVSPSQTDILFQALKREHITAERIIIPNAAHGGVYWEQVAVLDTITDFLNQYVKSVK